MDAHVLGTPTTTRQGAAALACALAIAALASPAAAQQFNSDNYVTMPHGVATLILTGGEHYSTLMNTFSLLPGWEFTAGVTMFKENPVESTTDHFALSLYAKHMFYENAAKTAGWAIMGGTGIYPGYLEAGTVTTSLNSYWVAAPITIPLFGTTLSWDIMPGANYNGDGPDGKAVWDATYSTRLAVYKVIPKTAIVAEAFGTLGESSSDAQYKVGLRWEATEHFVGAVSYGAAFDGSPGAGFEVGIMLFTPPFACFGGC